MDLEYKITTVAELAGAEAAADALERQIGKAKALKQDYSELQKELDTMRGSIAESKAAMESHSEASGKMGKDIEKAGEHAEESNIHFEGQRQLFNQLNRLAPELGHVLHAAFEGPLGAILLVGIAIHEARDKLNEYNEELDKQGEEAYAPHLTALAGLQKAWDDAATHMAEYNAKLEHAGEDKDPIATQIKRLKELEKAQIDSDKKIIESQAKVQEAYVRTRGAQLGQTPEQIETSVAGIKLREQRQIDSETDTEHAGAINALKLEQTDRQKNLATDPTAIAAAATAAGLADSKFQRDEAERQRLKTEGYGRALTEDEFAKLKKDSPGDERVQLSEAQENLEDLKKQREAAPEDSKQLFDPAIKNFEEEVERHAAAVRNTETLLKRLDDSFGARAQALNEAKEALAKAEAQYQLDVARLKELPAEIAQAMAVEAERQRGEHAATNNAGHESALKNLPPDLIGAVAGADQAYLSGHQLNNNQQQAIAQLKSFLDAAHLNSQEFLKLIYDGVRQQESLAQIVADVQRRIAQLNHAVDHH